MTPFSSDRRPTLPTDLHLVRSPVSRRVLYADDNRINQVVGAGALKKLGFEVDMVDDGRGAVAARTATDYAAILMDVMMPDVDGYQATRLIREYETLLGYPSVPIIGLSARAMAGDREIALDAGMDDYMTKPLRTSELAEVLGRWIDRAATGLAVQHPTS